MNIQKEVAIRNLCINMYLRGVFRGVLRVLEHPPWAPATADVANLGYQQLLVPDRDGQAVDSTLYN